MMRVWLNGKTELIALIRYLAASSKTLDELANKIYDYTGIEVSHPTISEVVGGWRAFKRARSLVCVEAI